jgi:predicted lipoprotein with Yx(FWY)xxD motif
LPATIKLAATKLGTVVVDSSGMTLYELDRDTATMPTCTGACNALWPPVVASGPSPVAGSGLDATKLGEVMVATGQQVEYGGHPLYRFVNDKAAGDVNGQGFAGGVWWVVGADGNKITTTAAAAAPAPTMAPATTPMMTTPMMGSRPGY